MRLHSLLFAVALCAGVAACSKSASDAPAVPATAAPTMTPTSVPTSAPSSSPSASPSGTHTPTPSPTASPTPARTASPSPSPTATSTGAHAASYAAIDAYYETLPHASNDADAKLLAAFMAKRPEFAAALQTPTGVASVFKDGTTYSISLDAFKDTDPFPTVSDRPARSYERPPSRVAGPRRTVASLRRAAESSGLPDLPASSGAYVLYTNISSSRKVADDVADALDKLGYTVHELQATIPNLMMVRDAGVFSLLGHSTIQLGLDMKMHPAFVTGVTNNSSDNSTYKNLLDSGDIELTSTVNFFGAKLALSAPQYAITAKFVNDRYMTFAKGAIVVAGACYSDGESFSELHGAFTAQGANYFGWTKEVSIGDAEQTQLYFFDRMAGEQYPSRLTTDVKQESPPQAAFDSVKVVGWMGKTPRGGLLGVGTLTESKGDFMNGTRPPLTGNSDADSYAYFERDTATDANPILAPSMHYLNYGYAANGNHTSLAAIGTFGETPGKVVIDDGNSHTLAIAGGWDDTAIVAVPPLGGTNGGAGYVTIVGANGAKSNRVALTQDYGTFTYTISGNETETYPATTTSNGSTCSGGSWTTKIKGGLPFNIHVKSTYELLRSEPGDPVDATTIQNAGTDFEPDSGSQSPGFSGAASGSVTYDKNDACATQDLSGSASAAGATAPKYTATPVGFNPPSFPSGFYGYVLPPESGDAASASQPISAGLSAALIFNLNPVGTESGFIATPGFVDYSAGPPPATKLQIYRYYGTSTYPAIRLKLGDDYSIANGTVVSNRVYGGNDGVPNGIDTLTWTFDGVQFPPIATDAR